MSNAIILIKVISFLGALVFIWISHGFATREKFLTLTPSSRLHRGYLVTVYAVMAVVWVLCGFWA